MTQNQVDHAVARATGESVNTIQRLGFLLADPDDDASDPDADILGVDVIDWDALALQRQLANIREARLASA